jgi:hypothetical protein
LKNHKKQGTTTPFLRLYGIYNYVKRENYKKAKGRIPSAERKEEDSKGKDKEGKKQ